MIEWLSVQSLIFPPSDSTNADGIIALGGDLSKPRLLLAYINGIFPWYNPGEPIVWHCPNPRFVMKPEDIHISKSMSKILKSDLFTVTYNKAFTEVIYACKNTIRRDDPFPSWITTEMEEAYIDLHDSGYAHSVEVWQNGKLVGGLYGIALGKIFFGESMFSTVSNASKFGFIKWIETLQKHSFELIDCQQETKHLKSLGAYTIPRNMFLKTLQKAANFEQLILSPNDITE